MRGIRRLSSFLQNRCITLNPQTAEGTTKYPSGFVSLDGSEPIEVVYSLVKSGLFISPRNKIETIHQAFVGVKQLCVTECPVVTPNDLCKVLITQSELLNRVLIPRDFWTLSDFNDPELNRSYGVQNLFFDNYKWSQVLWKRFQQFVEEYFPLSEHTHLRYQEYEELIRSFAAFEKGLRLYPVLSKDVRLHPPFGIRPPSRYALEPLKLLKLWIRNFKSPLMLNKALIVNCGCGTSTFAIKQCGIPMVCGVDSRPRAIRGCRKDAEIHRTYSTMKFQVGELFPSTMSQQKYDLIFFYPDEDLIEMCCGSSTSMYAPSFTGYKGKLEQFFDEVDSYLSDTGVIAIASSNLMSILRPFEPNYIEYEIKVNRRFVVLDYVDALMKSTVKPQMLSSTISLPHEAQRKIRSELWILHKLKAIDKFGYLHGIPGATPPSTLGRWKVSTMNLGRQHRIRKVVEQSGEDWGTYKGRLLTMLQEKNDVEEDELAETVRMTMDPTYPEELAKKSRKRVLQKMHEESQFHNIVATTFKDKSPREVFDFTVN